MNLYEASNSTTPTIAFTVAGHPAAQPRARARALMSRNGPVRTANGRVAIQHYTPASGDIGAWRQLVALAVRPHVPREPWDGPIAIDVPFWFVRTQELMRAKHGVEPRWHIVKPDLDNLIKAIKDVMTRERVWTDDSRVCQTSVAKRYCAIGASPGVVVRAWQLPPEAGHE